MPGKDFLLKNSIQILSSLLLVVLIAISSYGFSRVQLVDERVRALEINAPASRGQIGILEVKLDERLARFEERMNAAIERFENRCELLESLITRLYGPQEGKRTQKEER